LKSTTETVKHW